MQPSLNRHVRRLPTSQAWWGNAAEHHYLQHQASCPSSCHTPPAPHCSSPLAPPCYRPPALPHRSLPEPHCYPLLALCCCLALATCCSPPLAPRCSPSLAPRHSPPPLTPSSLRPASLSLSLPSPSSLTRSLWMSGRGCCDLARHGCPASIQAHAVCVLQEWAGTPDSVASPALPQWNGDLCFRCFDCIILHIQSA